MDWLSKIIEQFVDKYFEQKSSTKVSIRQRKSISQINSVRWFLVFALAAVTANATRRFINET